MLTIFTTHKPLNVASNQIAFCNAVRSWRRIAPTPQILVFGSERAIVNDEDATLVEVANPATPNGHPYFNDFIRQSEQLATNDILMYCTDHLVLTYDLADTISLLDARFRGPFVAIGRRWDVTLDSYIDFGRATWADDIRQFALKRGKYQSVGAKDYLIFRRPFPIPTIPPFIVGYPWYDTWAVVACQRAGIPVIDVSRTVFAIHQNHAFREGTIVDRENTPQTAHNATLASGMANQGHTTSAAWITTRFDVVSREQFELEEKSQ